MFKHLRNTLFVDGNDIVGIEFLIPKPCVDKIEIGYIELFREILFSALIFVVELDQLFSTWQSLANRK
ncbi:hypothetical protein RI543_004630 [Arxiozyma heterogenica]|uniref:Uncharacterized protein n=1 Tax=Arxiozyma heterogenica TaxID=278026 RepID=A0AAN7VZV6_9SACH|nr:hypothetical protein RI543_004630 [Kazachstania heterogenica]